jgi:hypothetical protein
MSRYLSFLKYIYTDLAKSQLFNLKIIVGIYKILCDKISCELWRILIFFFYRKNQSDFINSGQQQAKSLSF